MKRLLFLTLLLLPNFLLHQSILLAQTTTEDNNFKLEEQTPKFKLKRIAITGGTILADKLITQIIDKWVGQEVNQFELNQIASEIQQFYAQKGYTTSGAYVSSYAPRIGLVEIRIIEGKIEAVQVQGLKRLAEKYIIDKFKNQLNQPFNINELQQTLELLNLEDSIEDVTAQINPGTKIGQNILLLKIQEANSFNLNLIVKNDSPPTIGTLNRGLEIQQKSWITSADSWKFRYLNSDGGNKFSWRYSFPLNPQNTSMLGACGLGTGDILENNLKKLNIDSDSRYCFLGLTQTLKETAKEGIYLGGSFGFQNSESSVLDNPFRLSRGADEKGRTRTRPLRLYQGWVRRSTNSFFSLNNQLTLGLPIWGGTINNDETPDSRFFYYSSGAQYLHRFSDNNNEENSLLILKGKLQLSPISLPSSEQFLLSSFSQGVRGYRESFLLSDSGLFLSAELRLPLATIKDWDTVIQLAPFVDLATGWNEDNFPINPATISSLGLGLLVKSHNRLSAGIYWSYPLVELEQNQDSLQEQGVQFFVNWQALTW